MKVAGIVTEYNPFHNGHKYQIDKIREKEKDALIIICTSSSFTQRGDISILNKWDKTKSALNNGANIVLELPYIYSTQSSDTFAKYALKILNKLKIEELSFGSENNNIEKLYKVADTQINNKIILFLFQLSTYFFYFFLSNYKKLLLYFPYRKEAFSYFHFIEKNKKNEDV